jgi:hypothetical protein
VEKIGTELINVVFDKVENVQDPGEGAHEEVGRQRTLDR